MPTINFEPSVVYLVGTTILLLSAEDSVGTFHVVISYTFKVGEVGLFVHDVSVDFIFVDNLKSGCCLVEENIAPNVKSMIVDPFSFFCDVVILIYEEFYNTGT